MDHLVDVSRLWNGRSRARLVVDSQAKASMINDASLAELAVSEHTMQLDGTRIDHTRVTRKGIMIHEKMKSGPVVHLRRTGARRTSLLQSGLFPCVDLCYLLE